MLAGCIGEGQYGIVYRGQFRHLPVAVKTIKKTADVKYFKAILMEIKILCFVGEHRNLVNIIGASTRNIRKRKQNLRLKTLAQYTSCGFDQQEKYFSSPSSATMETCFPIWSVTGPTLKTCFIQTVMKQQWRVRILWLILTPKMIASK